MASISRQRRWALENPEKRREITRRYRERHRDEIAERDAIRRSRKYYRQVALGLMVGQLAASRIYG